MYLGRDIFSKALKEMDQTGNSLYRDVLEKKINSSWSNRNGNIKKSMARLETDWPMDR